MRLTGDCYRTACRGRGDAGTKVFENQIDQMSSAKYRIGGTIDEPVIEFVAIFDDKVAGVATEEPEQP